MSANDLVPREPKRSRIAIVKSTIGNTAWVLLCAYTGCLTIASFYTRRFWHDYGMNDFIPVTSTDWEGDWSIEEYLVFLLLPWLVVYYIKKGQRSDA